MNDVPTTGTRNEWAAPSIASPELMNAFQVGLPVRLVATPRRNFYACHVDEPLVDVVARNTGGFDHCPVFDNSDPVQRQIVGVVELASLRDKALRGCVRNQTQPLCEDNLIGADAGILSFVRRADANPFRLVVSGARIEGLVSLSDLQKLPVRAALFALIAQLEMTMGDAIRYEFNGTSKWKDRLSPERKRWVESRHRAAWKNDNWVDDLLFLGLADKAMIIGQSRLSTDNMPNFDTAIERVRSLRNNLAHADDYARTRKSAAEVCVTVRMIEDWIGRLNQWPSTQAAYGS